MSYLVSIHALLAECDGMILRGFMAAKSFNPRTPCGVRQSRIWRQGGQEWFQSTHSLRSATWTDPDADSGDEVSIHALLAECDRRRLRAWRRVFRFQSTHSLRSATGNLTPASGMPWVSIHALLAECDFIGLIVTILLQSFNPRTPCGVRLVRQCVIASLEAFQSTHSLRSATNNAKLHSSKGGVSIHALLAECDGPLVVNNPDGSGFNPRTPCGVRLGRRNFYVAFAGFQSTHSLRSATHVQ